MQNWIKLMSHCTNAKCKSVTSRRSDFTNILRSAFTIKDPKGSKRQLIHQCLFAYLGSALVNAARKTLAKSTQAHVNSLTIFYRSEQLRWRWLRRKRIWVARKPNSSLDVDWPWKDSSIDSPNIRLVLRAKKARPLYYNKYYKNC